MKIHRIVNPIAYENTYLLENEDYLLVVDPGVLGNKFAAASINSQNQLLLFSSPIPTTTIS